MRAYININQKAFSELAILKSTKIDLIDATIFEYIVKFAVSNKATKQLIDDKLFIWCSYQKIIDDNPLLNINSKKAIELRLIKLIDLGLFEKFTDKKEGNKTYFNVTDLAYKLIIENISISNIHYQPLVTEITNLSNEDYQPLSNEDYYNSKLINSKLDNNKTTDISYDDFYLLWNNFANKNNLSKIAKLSDGRKKKILARHKDFKDFKVAFEIALKKANESSFLLNGSFFTFDWLVENDTNILKVLEDKYKDKTNSNIDDKEWSDGTTRCDPNEYR